MSLNDGEADNIPVNLIILRPLKSCQLSPQPTKQQESKMAYEELGPQAAMDAGALFHTALTAGVPEEGAMGDCGLV